MKGLMGIVMAVCVLMGFLGFILIVMTDFTDMGTLLLVVGCIGVFFVRAFAKGSENQGDFYDDRPPF